MLIVRITLTILRRVHHHLAPVILVLGNQCPATRRRNHLIAVKAQHAILTECTKHLPLVARAETLSCILHHGDTILIRDLHDAVSLVRHTVQRHRHDSGRLLPRLGNPILNRFLQQLRVDIPRVRLRIHQHRFRPQIRHGMRRRTERKALHDHLIPRLHPCAQ